MSREAKLYITAKYSNHCKVTVLQRNLSSLYILCESSSFFAVVQTNMGTDLSAEHTCSLTSFQFIGKTLEEHNLKPKQNNKTPELNNFHGFMKPEHHVDSFSLNCVLIEKKHL